MQGIQPLIIVGAGPIGLLLANLLGQNGIHAVLYEKRLTRSPISKAIGITPPSLQILNSLGLAQSFVNEGVPITTAEVYGAKHQLGSLSFSRLKGNFPFILSIPQYLSELLLLDNLKRFPHIEYKPGYTFLSLTKHEKGLFADFFSEETQKTERIFSPKLFACDGGKSDVRNFLNLPFPGRALSQTFFMGDFEDQTPFGPSVKLFFTPAGAVESFPLPHQKRRWVIQTPSFLSVPPENYLVDQIAKRTSIILQPETLLWQGPFGVQRFLSPQFTALDNRVYFAGDSAHLMPPIGGQGMNTGFADALLLARCLTACLPPDKKHAPGLYYTKMRRKAANTAARRAVLSMWIGTRRGRLFSFLRNCLLFLLLHSPFKKLLPPTYAMQNIPGNNQEARQRPRENR